MKQKKMKIRLRERNMMATITKREKREMTFIGLRRFSSSMTDSEPTAAPVKSAKYICPLCPGWYLKTCAINRLDRMNGGRKVSESKSGWARSTMVVRGSIMASGNEIAKSIEIVISSLFSNWRAEAMNPPTPKPNIAIEIARKT